MHSRLSASESHRWIPCPGSCRVCAGIPRKGNPAATKGTATHHVGAEILKGSNELSEAYHAKRIVGVTFKFEDTDDEGKIVIREDTVDDKMLDAVNIYVEHVWAILEDRRYATLYVEERLLLDHVFPDMGGTADVMIDDVIDLIVIDYKNGMTPVILVHPGYDPDRPDLSLLNSQLLMYAAGAAHRFLWMHDNITIQVVQPNCFSVPDIQSVTIPADLLKAWMEEDLKRHAEATEEPDAPLVPGPHCDWCPAAPFCTALRAKLREVATTEFDGIDDVSPELLTEEQSLDILEWGPRFESLFRRVSAVAFERLMRGKQVKGYKIVMTSPNRKWPTVDPEELKRLLTEAGADVTVAQLIGEPEVLSPSQVETRYLKGKKGKAIVAKVAVKPKGTPTMAPETNARPAVAVSSGLEDIMEEVE